MWPASGTLRQMYDCYVIGSDPAGITLALELAKANKRALLFESGTAIDARTDMPNAINYGHLRNEWWGRHSIRALDGTSKVWTGLCVTLSERDFYNPAGGVRWPITRSVLVPYYRRVAEILDRAAPSAGVRLPAVLNGCSDPRRQKSLFDSQQIQHFGGAMVARATVSRGTGTGRIGDRRTSTAGTTRSHSCQAMSFLSRSNDNGDVVREDSGARSTTGVVP